MYRSAFRHLTVKGVTILKHYPKLSFLGGVIITAASFCSFKQEKVPSKIPLSLGFRISQSSKQPIINLKEFLAFQKNLELIEFKARAPLYPEEQIYVGYDLLKILAAASNRNKSSDDLVVLMAKDGFISHIPYTLVSKYNPKVAILQKSAPAAHAWEEVIHPLSGKTDGGPYYLMWPGTVGKDVVDNHWAFGITEITFGSFQKIFGELSPNSPDHGHGFKLFAQNCGCCHTFFGKGSANIGPSFESILKKYLPGSIAAYAAKPPPKSLMPEQELTREELEAIENYVRFKADEASGS